MKYLGLNFVCGTSAVGIYDPSSNQFALKKSIPPLEYFQLYKKRPNLWRHLKTKYLYKKSMNSLLEAVSEQEINHVTLTDFFGSPPSLELVPYFKRKFRNFPLLLSDHKWGHINAVKFHPEFQYPAFVADCSAQHSILAYLPNPQKIEVVYDSDSRQGGTFTGLGKSIIYGWVHGAGEPFYWRYETYSKRAIEGKIVFVFEEEVEQSRLPFAEDVLVGSFPLKMEAIKKNYSNLEAFRNDWVATQHELLRCIFRKIQKEYQKQYEVKTWFVGGGISRNTAFQNLEGWLRVPDIVGGDDGSGCFMAYLGYHVHQHGLDIPHDRWKGFITRL